MLDAMRRNSRSTLIYVLFAILIAVFVLTFNAANTGDSARALAVEPMAKVKGTTIDSGTLDFAMRLSAEPPQPGTSGFEKLQARQRFEQTRLIFTNPLPEAAQLVPHATPPRTLEDKVLGELVEQLLVVEEAKARGLQVSDDEVSARVLGMQRFFPGLALVDENGNFNARAYDNFVRGIVGTSKQQFEDFLRREILRDKLALAVTAGIVATPDEVDALYDAEFNRTRLEYIALDAATAAKAISVSDDEATAWAATHEAEIQKAYDADANYKVPDKYNLRGILVAAPNPENETDAAKKDAVVAERAGKKAAAEAIAAELKKAWAGEVLLDPVKKPAAEGAAEDPNAGLPLTATQVTGEDKNARLLQYFSKLATEKTEDEPYKDLGGKYVDDYTVEALGRSPFGPAVAALIPTAAEAEVLGPVEGAKGWWVLVVDKKLPGKVTPLADVRLTLAKQLLQTEKAERELPALADAVLAAAAATPTTALADVAKAYGQDKAGNPDALSVQETPPLGKSPLAALTGGIEAALGLAPKNDDPDEVPGIGKLPELAKAAAQLKASAPVATKVFKSEDGKTLYVVRRAASKPQDEAETKKQKDQLAQTLTRIKKIETYRAFAQGLIQKATADKQVERTEAFALKLKEAEARLVDTAADAASQLPKGLNVGGDGTIKLNVGGQEVPVQLQPGPPPAAQPAGGNDAPAAPAPSAPAAPAAPAEPAAK